MSNINKILFLFITMILLSLIGAWNFLQSEWVAKQISVVITKIAEQKYNSQVRFNNLQFNLFPPGLEVNNVRISGEYEKNKFTLEVGRAGIYFKAFDIFRTKLKINTIVISDGDLKVERRRDGSSNKIRKSTIKTGAYHISEDLLSRIPVREFLLNDFRLVLDKYDVFTKSMKLGVREKSISLNGRLEQTHLEQFIDEKWILDSVQLDAIVGENKILLNDFTLKHGLMDISLNGNIQNYTNKEVTYQIEGSAGGPIQKLHEFVEMREIAQLNYGNTKVAFALEGIGSQFKIVSDLQLENFKTDFIYGEKLKLKMSIDNERIIFRKVSLIAGEQKLKLLKPFEFYNLKTKKFIEEPILARAEKLKFQNFLRYLRDDISMIEGKLSGVVKFVLGDNNYYFEAKKDVVLNGFKILVGAEKELFELNNIALETGLFTVRENTFKMNFDAHSGESNFTIKSEISSDVFRLAMPHGFVNLEHFGPFLGFETTGMGNFSFEMFRNENRKMILSTKSDFKHFSFEGYNLDVVKADVDFLITDNVIDIKKLTAASSKTHIDTEAKINYITNEISGKYTISNLNFTETKKIFKPLLGDIKLTSNEIHGNWFLDGKITGKMNLKDLDLSGSFKGKSNFIFNENFDSLKFDYQIKNNLLNVENFIASKSTGHIAAAITYSFLKDILDFKLNLHSINLNEISAYSKIPLTIQGELNGGISGKRTRGKVNVVSNLTLSKTMTNNYRYDNSKIKASFSEDIMKLNIKAFGSEIELDSKLFFNKKKSTQSHLKLGVELSDFARFMDIFSGVEPSESKISGSMLYYLDAQFDVLNTKLHRLSSHLKKIKFHKGPVIIDYKAKAPEIVVQKGKILKWDMNIRGRKAYFISKGRGNFLEEYDVFNRMKIDASVIEVFNKLVSKADGNIRGKVHLFNDKGFDDYDVALTSKNLSLTTSFLPTDITKGDVRVEYKNKKILIKGFSTKLVSGSFNVGGEIDLSRVVPDININYKFVEAGVPILKKSELVFSGTGTVSGKAFPYAVTGDFLIKKFVLINEFSDLGGDAQSIIAKEIEYLPNETKSGVEELISLNISVNTGEPLIISNSLADIGFVGSVQIVGGENNPRVIGKVNLAPRENKITFKNNVFKFSKGAINFVEQASYKNPDLNLVTSSTINDYKVFIKFVGPLKDFNLEFSSEPALSQSDILSLIALGYTEDLSNNLSDAEKESMTRAGVGSMIFDSFKINETLKNEFGVQINLGTKISEEAGSYLSRRDASGANSVGKVRSATTFEIKKQLNEAISLSVSSTVGTTTDKSQKVNLNYNINKNVSFEGVYESQTDDDSSGSNKDTSVGADVKWRWSFK